MTGTVGEIADGDTFTLCNGGDCTKIRLCGIDAPENAEAGAKEATVALTTIVEGKYVRCIPVDRGSVCDGRSQRMNSGRLVAQCYVGRTDIAAELVKLGHACDWRKFSGGHYGKIEGACQK